MKNLKLMNEYVANLGVLNVKLHNLHWNVTGRQFMSIHLFTEELYDELFVKYDEIAEHIKMLGFVPLASLKEYLAVTTIEELPSRAFSEKEVLDYLEKDLMLLTEKANIMRKNAEETDDFKTVALLEGHVIDYTKKLWFVQTMNQ